MTRWQSTPKKMDVHILIFLSMRMMLDMMVQLIFQIRRTLIQVVLLKLQIILENIFWKIMILRI